MEVRCRIINVCTNGLFICTICNNNIQPIGGILVHVGSSFSQTSRLWEGPFICISCKNKDGVENKLPHLKFGLLEEGWSFSLCLRDNFKAIWAHIFHDFQNSNLENNKHYHLEFRNIYLQSWKIMSIWDLRTKFICTNVHDQTIVRCYVIILVCFCHWTYG